MSDLIYKHHNNDSRLLLRGFLGTNIPGDNFGEWAWIRQSEGKLEPTEVGQASWWVIQNLLKTLEDSGFLSEEAQAILDEGGEILLVGGMEDGDRSVGIESTYIWDLSEGEDKTIPIYRTIERIDIPSPEATCQHYGPGNVLHDGDIKGCPDCAALECP